MNSHNFRVLIYALVLIPILGCNFDPIPIFGSKPVHGTVIDAVTGVPLENVIVMGHWPDSQVKEILSGPNGIFLIPAWTTLPIPDLNKTHHDHAVTINFYKRGYLPKSISNHFPVTEQRSKASYDWQWNGQIIELQPIDETWSEVFQALKDHRSKRINYRELSEYPPKIRKEVSVMSYQWTLFNEDAGIWDVAAECALEDAPRMTFEMARYLQNMDTSNEKEKTPLIDYLTHDCDMCGYKSDKELEKLLISNNARNP
jgi:hypothetical protein